MGQHADDAIEMIEHANELAASHRAGRCGGFENGCPVCDGLINMGEPDGDEPDPLAPRSKLPDAFSRRRR
jgi:hypothetical protein